MENCILGTMLGDVELWNPPTVGHQQAPSTACDSQKETSLPVDRRFRVICSLAMAMSLANLAPPGERIANGK